MKHLPDGVSLEGPSKGFEKILTPEALSLVANLHREFNHRRNELLEQRVERQARIDAGENPDFRTDTVNIRESDWQVGPAPKDLNDRRAEITGPVDRKMMINALNSGAKVFMADLEDATSPTWSNVVEGQINLRDAVRRTIRLEDRDRDRIYQLGDDLATLVVRPRGWHLPEKHLIVDGDLVSASLFDFGLYMFHNANAALELDSGPYFYLPKLEGHLEARLWNDVFDFTQDALEIPRGTIRATVLIETILAAFEMDEILYELRSHMAGLNAGRWDYIFSVIKKFSQRENMLLPDRAEITMGVPFMRAYAELLVKTCHRRGAHAIGGMAAFIPSRRDPGVNEKALAKVREDKKQEAGQGYDGTWVAHPDLIPLAEEAFGAAFGDSPNQKTNMREDLEVSGRDLLDLDFEGNVTHEGVRMNIDVALQYLNAWFSGNGAAAIYNLMEDAATAEISRAQLWQWIRHGAKLADGRTVNNEMYKNLRDEEYARLTSQGAQRYPEAVETLDKLVLTERFAPFLTLPAYEKL
jgi:malate synthase